MKPYPMVKFLIFCFGSFIFISCNDQITVKPFPELETLNVTNIDSFGADFSAELKYLGTSPIINYGFVWDTKEKPTLKSGHYYSLGESDSAISFSLNITKDLCSDTIYYVRAFAENDEFIVYGNEVSFFSLGCEFSSWESSDNFEDISRFGAVSFTIGNSIYVGFGYTGNYDFNYMSKEFLRNDFWKYDFDTKLWARVADFPGNGRINAIGFSINGKGYIGTGFEANGYEKTRMKDFWEYNPKENSWTRRKDFPGDKRSGSIGFSANNKGYIGLGGNVYGTSYLNKYNDLWEYDPEYDTWSRKSDFEGNASTSLTCIVLNNMAYVGLGNWNPTSGINSGNYSSEFWEYNCINDKWSRIKDFPAVPRMGAVGFSLNNKVYVGTGNTGRRSSKYQFYNDFWEYDPQLQKWTRKPDIYGSTRTMAIGFVLNDSGYIGLGANSSGEIFKYDP